MCQSIENVNERGNQVYIFTPVPSRPHVHADGCLFILGKERVELRAWNNNNLMERRRRWSICGLSWVMNTIVGQFERDKKKNKHTHTFRIWSYYSKDLGVVIVTCQLALKCCLFFNCHMSHLIECQTSLIEEAKSIWWFFHPTQMKMVHLTKQLH